MKIVMALVAALAATPTWADSAADEAIRRAQVCSNDKAVKYSRETAESPQTIAAAAFGAILYSVVTGDSIVTALTNIITRALNTNV